MPSIIVCMKIIMDLEMPFSIFKVDRENRKPVPPSGMPPVYSPFDENALEAALKLKDQRDCKVTVLSIGKALPKVLLQKILALGADELIALEDPEFDHLDPFNAAQVLADAIKKKGLELIQETANLLGGAIAGSRPAVDYGWVPSSLQVGLTGKR